MFALLAAGGPTEDMLLETVGLDRLHWLGLRLWLGFKGDGQWRTDRRWVWWQWRVWTDRGRQGRRALISQRGFSEGRRRWHWWWSCYNGWWRAGFTITALEKVVHTFAAHDWFEGQGALQPLQLKEKVKMLFRKASVVKNGAKLQALPEEL